MKKQLFAGLMLALSMPLMAEGIEEMGDTSRVQDLDEVIVVSQPKEQVRLRLQPLSSTVMVGDQLNQLHITDLSQLSQFVPSFTMPAYGSRLTSSMYVRGIGSRINNPAVGVYYDNMPLMSKSAFNNHFYMVDRVDVLRGPQGTLYGQNTEGGLVRIYTKNPMNYQGTDVNLGLGTGLYSNIEVAHYHRPSDTFAFSVAGFYSGLNGFIDNQNFEQKNDLTNEAGARMRFVWQPTQKLNFDLVADYQYVNQNGFGYGEAQLSTLNSPLSTINSQLSTIEDPATTLMNGYKRNMLNTGLNISYDFGPLLFTSTTSYQYLRDLMLMDQDYMAPDYLQLIQRQKQNAVTQEFVLRSHSYTRWQHTSGLFGSYQWLRTDAPVYFGEEMRNTLAATILGYMPERVRSMFTTWEIPVLDVAEQFHTPQMNLGLFHESNILLTNRLKATLGFRLNYDKVKIDYQTQALMTLHYAAQMGPRSMEYTNGLLSPLAQSLDKSFTQFLPKVGLTYNFDRNLGNVYALVSKGYRSGGYNIQMFSDILQSDLMANGKDISSLQNETKTLEHSADDYAAIEETISYEPEESWNYEVGTHLNLFENRLHLDLALFYMQIRNQQLSIMVPDYNYGRVMVNAGKSHSCGLELALRGKAFGGQLDWNATYGYTSAKFDDYVVKLNNVGVNADIPWFDESENHKGNYVPFVPQHTFSLAGDYHFTPQFTLGLNLTGQGKTWWDEANTFSQKFYALLGAHADYDFGPAVISLWARNLTDTQYNTFAVQSSAAGGTRYFAQRANPFQAGIDLRLHF
ncbi:MAG: TonB-dependent receptor [Prevotella sp.]|nr:TonB-dependent receptor [Prevotella sp.]